MFTKKKTAYNELLRRMYGIGGMTWVFFGAGSGLLFATITLMVKGYIRTETLYIFYILTAVSCMLFLTGGVGWIIRFYLSQKTITRILTTIENVARVSKTGTEFQAVLETLNNTLLQRFFQELPIALPQPTPPPTPP